jgi:plasmid stabilization system protein ParE
MASPIIRSLLAERDLVELFDYIAVDASEDRAEAVLRRIDQTLETLAFMPRIGRVRGDLVGSPRSFSIWPWLIIYERNRAARAYTSCGSSTDAATCRA